MENTIKMNNTTPTEKVYMNSTSKTEFKLSYADRKYRPICDVKAWIQAHDEPWRLLATALAMARDGYDLEDVYIDAFLSVVRTGLFGLEMRRGYASWTFWLPSTKEALGIVGCPSVQFLKRIEPLAESIITCDLDVATNDMDMFAELLRNEFGDVLAKNVAQDLVDAELINVKEFFGAYEEFQ